MTDAEKLKIYERALETIYWETASGQGAQGFGSRAEQVAGKALKATGKIR